MIYIYKDARSRYIYVYMNARVGKREGVWDLDMCVDMGEEKQMEEEESLYIEAGYAKYIYDPAHSKRGCGRGWHGYLAFYMYMVQGACKPHTHTHLALNG